MLEGGKKKGYSVIGGSRNEGAPMFSLNSDLGGLAHLEKNHKS